MATILEVQTALAAAGFVPGPVDGIFGRLTRSALEQYQYKNSLPVTGLPDAGTVAKLLPPVPQRLPLPVWYGEARRLLGTAEAPGARSNATILGWARRLGGWIASVYRDDSTPWCGLFVAHCISATLSREPLPANPLSALAWAKFGKPPKSPSIGAVLVFKRPGGGHVGFYAGEDATAFHVLGGNQKNKVSIARVAKSRLVAIRWPVTASPPVTGPVALAPTQPISTNEQ